MVTNKDDLKISEMLKLSHDLWEKRKLSISMI